MLMKTEPVGSVGLWPQNVTGAIEHTLEYIGKPASTQT